MSSRSVPLWIPILLALLAPAIAIAQSDQVTSLREGNRLVREGRHEEAYEVFRAGYDATDPNPILAYNLGTTAHRLDRLPEAILWYRRAEALNPTDPWLQGNLVAARATLGLQPYPSPGAAGLLSRHRQLLFYLSAIIAWMGAAFWLARPRARPAPTIALFGVALLVYGAAFFSAWKEPVPAVVVDGCSAPEADLPEGSEVWIVGAQDDMVRLAAGSLTLACPAASVATVMGEDLPPR